MKVTCPGCGFEGNISDSLIPEEGKNVTCPKCKHKFFITNIKYENNDLINKIVEKEWRDFAEKINKSAIIDDPKKIFSICNQPDENPNKIIQQLREEVFGLKKGERNKEITNLARAIFRINISKIEAQKEKMNLEEGVDIGMGIRSSFIGVRFLSYFETYENNPCPNKICEKILKKGRNFTIDGGEFKADFYLSDGPIPWFPHCPHCNCIVLRHLFERDLEKMK